MTVISHATAQPTVVKVRENTNLRRHAGNGRHVVSGLNEQVVVLLKVQVPQPGSQYLPILQ